MSIEKWMKWEEKISGHPKLIFISTILITIVFIFIILTRAKVSSDVTEMMPKSHPVKAFYDKTNRDFGVSAGIFIVLDSPDGYLNYKTLKKIREITRKIELIDNRIAKKRLNTLFSTWTASRLNALHEMLNENIYSNKNYEAFLNLFKKSELLSEYFESEKDIALLNQMADSQNIKMKKLYKIYMTPRDNDNKWFKRVRDVKSLANTDYVYARFSTTQLLMNFFENQGISGQKGLDISNFLLENNIVNPKTWSQFSNKKKFGKLLEILNWSEQDSLKLQNLSEKQLYKWFQFIQNSAKLIQVSSLLDWDKLEKSEKREIYLLQNRLESWDLYKNFFYSPINKNLTAILVEPVPLIETKETGVLYNEIKEILKESLSGTHIKAYIAGEPVVTELVGSQIVRDVRSLFPTVILVLIIFLLFSFKHFPGVFLPVLAVFLSVVWTFGTIFITGKALSVMGSTIPVILVAVASGDGIHIVHRYYDHTKDKLSKIGIHRLIIRGVGLAVIMTSFTTIAGFLSMLTNTIIPIREFGLFTSIGVFYALIISLFLIPAFLKYLPVPKQFEVQKEENTIKKEHFVLAKVLKYFSYLSLSHPWKVISIFAIIVASAIFCSRFLITDMAPISYFKENTAIRTADKIIKKNLAGTSNLDLVIDTHKKNGILDPNILNAVDRIQKQMEKNPLIGKSNSVVNLIKKMNQTYHFGAPDYYRIPSKLFNAQGKIVILQDKKEKNSRLRSVIYSYISQFKNKDIRLLIDSEKKRLKVSFILKSSSSRDTSFLSRKIKELSQRLLPEYCSIRFSGFNSIIYALNKMIINGQIWGISLAVILVMLMVILMERSIRLGLISVLPLLVAVIVSFGIMGLAGITLNVATAIVSSIAIGTGVDYIIHYFNDYLNNLKSKDKAEALFHSTVKTGEAILINGISVSAAFLVFLLSDFKNLQHTGFMASLIMFTICLSALTLIPAILKIIPYKKNES